MLVGLADDAEVPFDVLDDIDDSFRRAMRPDVVEGVITFDG